MVSCHVVFVFFLFQHQSQKMTSSSPPPPPPTSPTISELFQSAFGIKSPPLESLSLDQIHDVCIFFKELTLLEEGGLKSVGSDIEYIKCFFITHGQTIFVLKNDYQIETDGMSVQNYLKTVTNVNVQNAIKKLI